MFTGTPSTRAIPSNILIENTIFMYFFYVINYFNYEMKDALN